MDYNHIKLWCSEDIEKIIWDDSENHRLIRDWIPLFVRDGSRKYIANTNVKVFLLQYHNTFFPITVNEANWNSSYVVSPYNIVIEAKSKFNKLNLSKLSKMPGVFILNFISICLKILRFDNVVFINNFMVTTNLYPELPGELDELTKFLIEKFPGKMLIWRSINSHYNNNYIQALEKANYSKVYNRLVWLVLDPLKSLTTVKNKSFCKVLNRDKKLFDQPGYEIKKLNEESEVSINELKKLYDQLYLNKHSLDNPQYTKDFFKLILSLKSWTVLGLFKNSQLVGFTTYFSANKIITFPFLGYDREVDINSGLFRMLMYLEPVEAERLNCILNQSSGIDNFKRYRGATGVLEWNLVNTDGLNVIHQFALAIYFKIFNMFANFFLRKYKSYSKS